MKPSGVITLTTDFGLSDPYVAMMKGVILTINPTANLVDLSHLIGAGAILQAASLIHESFLFFPPGSIHIGVVDPGVGSKRRLLALKAQEHFFVGPDNGLFWPVIQDSKDVKIVQLTERKYFLPRVSQTFHGREIFAPVAAHLSAGIALELMGVDMNDPVPLDYPQPLLKDGFLYGRIMRVDNFGNLITNIQHRELEQFLKSSQPFIEVGKLAIKGLSFIYADADEGEPLAQVNSSGHLEIAVNMGRASEYLGLDTGEIIGTVVKIGIL
ncbi:S-adenosyl-l-methionine hydroxide adenosyltransferase family protein [Thermodesulfobacteriota bacterium]